MSPRKLVTDSHHRVELHLLDFFFFFYKVHLLFLLPRSKFWECGCASMGKHLAAENRNKPFPLLSAVSPPQFCP